ncbi:MAG: protein kinase [Nitrospira sp.]
MSALVYSDKYEVQEKIAQGGMGIVYKALDLKLNRVVALKVVHPHLTSDPSFLQRFLREARAMARLQHENIVSIFSVEQDHGTQFIVMEYFEGTSLVNRIQTRVILPLDEAVTITSQMAKALAYAHKHGIIHRDVKPANVLIGSDSRIKLTDFGIAAALGDTPLTSAGQLIGTLLYMSPEQARDATLDGRSDLYSLGLMFYEMLTGTHPRRNLSTAAILGMLGKEEEVPPLAFPLSVPTEAQAVVKDLLRYRPVDRIKDAHQLLRRLERLQAGGSASQSSSGKRNPVTTNQTIFELRRATDKTIRKKRTKQPDITHRALTILFVCAAVLGSGAGLYAVFPIIKSLFSSSQLSGPPIQNMAPPSSSPAPQPVQEKQDLVPAPILPVAKPAPSLNPENPKLLQSPPKPTQVQARAESTLIPASPAPTFTPQPVQEKQDLVPAPILPVAKPAPSMSPENPELLPLPPKPTQVQARAEPTPILAPKILKIDQRPMDLLEQLRRLITEKNLSAISEASVMSEDRRLTLETLFANYSTLETSLGDIINTPTSVIAVLRIDKLVLPSGETLPPGASLRKIRITIPRQGDEWGKAVW